MADCMLEAIPLPHHDHHPDEIPQPPPERPRVEKIPGKRRMRRRMQLEYLLSLEKDVEEDVVYHRSQPLLESEELLRAYLNGAHRKTKPKSALPKGPPRMREAVRGWLRIERRLRIWIRKADADLVHHVDSLVRQWIASDADSVLEPMVPGVVSPSTILRIPTCVVDPAVVKAIAQFYAARLIQSDDTFIVLRRPQPHHRLLHEANLFDVI